jgi:hypothetical protein
MHAFEATIPFLHLHCRETLQKLTGRHVGKITVVLLALPPNNLNSHSQMD